MKVQSGWLALAVASTIFLPQFAGCGGPPASSPEADAGFADAEAFVAEVEEWEREFGEYESRVLWVNESYITYDTDWLASRVEAEGTQIRVDYANIARAFDDADVSPDTRRKLDKIKLGVNVPAPTTVGVARELAGINTSMRSRYGAGAIELDGQTVSGPELEVLMGTERDPDRLLEMWTKWREVAVPMKDEYARAVEIANAGARELGYADMGAMWRSRYDLPPDEFATLTDELWDEVRPLYDPLMCHVRARLNDAYGDDVVPLDQPIPAHLLGNMWAQSWGNIHDLVAPPASDASYDLTELLAAAEYDPLRIFETAEGFFSSLGFEPLPETFWERSIITKPVDHEMVCHASAWNLDREDDIRTKMCTTVNADDFVTVHHELGHNYYDRAYNDQPMLYRDGANDGFHEAIGDMLALSVTPDYLREIGLLEEVPDASADLGLLMQRALDRVAFLPFGLLVDRWRWQVFDGTLTPDTYTDGWWALRREYQGVRPPVERTSDHFDPGAKFHIPTHVEYTRYFIAGILQFQFHQAACEIAGWEGPLHRCSIYGNAEVGERFRAMMEMGASRPWPEALEVFTGSSEMTGSSVVEYFAPLVDWLEAQNEGRDCTR
jgi:peptidyl-dipeptidase A